MNNISLSNIKEVSQEELVARARQRLGMYIHRTQYGFNPASCYLNFLYGVLDQDSLGTPDSVQFISSGEHHLAIAHSCQSPIEYDGNSNLDKWFHSNAAMRSLGMLSAAVLTTEFALLDITAKNGQVRQLYQDGVAISPCIFDPIGKLPDDAPYISFHFIFSPFIDAQKTLSQEQMLTIWKEWRNTHTKAKRVRTTTKFYIPLLSHARTKIHSFAPNYFSMRIEWTRERSIS